MIKTKNANMFQKSIIQQYLEFNAVLENFKDSLNKLMEDYTIKGNVFGCPQGHLLEITNGYFVVESEKDNIQDAIREMNNLNKYIRIVDNERFQVGTITNYLSECANGLPVIDIEYQTNIEQ